MNAKFQAEIDELGRVTIAPELLSALNLSPGATLLVEEKNGKLTLEPVQDQPILMEKDGLLVLHVQPIEDLSNIIEKERQKRILELMEIF